MGYVAVHTLRVPFLGMFEFEAQYHTNPLQGLSHNIAPQPYSRKHQSQTYATETLAGLLSNHGETQAWSLGDYAKP